MWGMCIRRKKHKQKHGKELSSETSGSDGLYSCGEERGIISVVENAALQIGVWEFTVG